MTQNFDKVYRVNDDDELNRDHFNRRYRDFDSRIHELEENKDVADKAVDALNRFGLERIDAALAPNLQRIQDAASLGFLSAHVAADFQITFQTGPTAVPLLKDARQELFTPAPFLVLMRTSDPSSYAVAQSLGYNRTTGVLQIDVLSVYGAPGPFSDVEVWAVAGSALALKQQIKDASEAKTESQAARLAAETAAGTASNAATASVSARNRAETAAQQAETAARTAQNTSAGSVKVTSTDNTPGVLQTKLTASSPLKADVTAPTGDARMNLTVAAATTFDPGVVRFAAAADITNKATNAAVTPAQLADAVQGASGDANTSLFFESRSSNTALALAKKAHWINLTGTFTQTFVAAATLGNGWWCYLKNAGTGEITLDPNSSEQIDGVTSYKMYPGEVRLIQCDGAAFRTMIIQGFAVIFRGPGQRTFNRPPGYAFFDIACLAGGGGGEGGGSRSNPVPSTDRHIYGGCAGSGAALTRRRVSFAEMAATETINIGDGGAGGAGRAAQASLSWGFPGADGQPTTFGGLLYAAPGRGGYASNGVGGATRRGAQPGSSSGGGDMIRTANADNEILLPEFGGGGGGEGTNADNGLYYSFSGGRSIEGGNGGGAGGGFWVGNGYELYQGQQRPGGAGGAPYNAANPNSLSGGGPNGGANAWDTTGGAGANGGIVSDNRLPGTGGGGGGASNRRGGNGGGGGPGSGGGGGGCGFYNEGGTGGKGGPGACSIAGVV